MNDREIKEFERRNDGKTVEHKHIDTSDILDYKVLTDDVGYTYIQGYANTKGKPDAYGDVPTNFDGKDVYDLSRYKQNPTVFIDHMTSTAKVAGKMLKIVEDEKGLFFKAQLMKNPIALDVAHAIEAYKEGFARGISIGGLWYFDDPENPKHLTRAYIHEISLVGVGADSRALVEKQIEPSEDGEAETPVKQLAAMIGEFRETKDSKIVGRIAKSIENNLKG